MFAAPSVKAGVLYRHLARRVESNSILILECCGCEMQRVGPTREECRRSVRSAQTKPRHDHSAPVRQSESSSPPCSPAFMRTTSCTKSGPTRSAASPRRLSCTRSAGSFDLIESMCCFSFSRAGPRTRFWIICKNRTPCYDNIKDGVSTERKREGGRGRSAR